MSILAVKTIIDQAEEITHPEPDLSILQQGRKKPPCFPIEVFGDEIGFWLLNAAAGAGAPVDYVAGALLAASGALIGNARRISPWKAWDEPAALWIGLVGDPSSNKSPAIDPVINILRAIENDMATDFALQYREWEAQKEVAAHVYEEWKKDIIKARKGGASVPIKPEAAHMPEEITRPRILANDTSIEKLGLLLSAHKKGLLFYRDELSGWFGNFDRYSGQDGDRAFWIESYGGRSYVIDRVKHNVPIRIQHLLVSVMGGIQPDKLTNLIKGADDGFTSRFLWIWADPIPPFRPLHVMDNTVMTSVFRKLARLAFSDDTTPKVINLSEEAANLFQNWRKKHYISEQYIHGLLKSSYGKAPGHLLRIALSLEVLWWAASQTIYEPEFVSTKAILAAVRLMDDYFKPMAERVFGDASISEEEKLATTLARYIVRTKLNIINLRKVRREARLQGLSKADKIQVAANNLIEAGWLFEADGRTEVGRPRGDYVVNPRLWEVS